MSQVKAVIYARLSQEDRLEDTSLSIQNQITNLKRYIMSHSYDFIKVYADDGYTGGTMNRPAFQQMLKDLYQHKFNTIIVKDISRIGRNLIEVGHFIEEICPLERIRVISVLDQYDSDFYTNDDSIVFRSFMNDYYLKECKKKAYKSLESRITKKPLNTIPYYGYILRDKRFILHPEEAHVVKRIFDDYAKGVGTFELARKLKEEQIYCPAYSLNHKIQGKYSYKTPYDWSPNAIQRILKRKAYTGIHINGTFSKHFKELELENAYEAIIPLSLYESVQKKLKENQKNKFPPSKYAHFFYNKQTGIAGHLERRTTRTIQTKTGKLRTETFDPRLSLENFSVSIPILEKILRKEINRLFKELTQDKRYLADLITKDSNYLKKQIEDFQIAILKKESQMKRLIELRVSNQMNIPTYKDKMERAKEERRLLESKLANLKKQSSKESNQCYDQVIDKFLSLKQKNQEIMQIAKTLFKRIEIEKVNGKLILEFQYKCQDIKFDDFNLKLE